MPGTASSSKKDGKASTTSTCCGVRMELFSEAKALWAGQHNQIACQHDKDTVVLFRACCQHLGPHAATTGSFRGSPCYEKDSTRMMWFDTSFLVSMRKSIWGKKSGREIVLAVWVKRSFLEDCLGKAVCSNIFGSAAPSASSAAVAAAYGGGRPKPVRSLRARVGSGNPMTGGSEAFASAAATAAVQLNNQGSPISSSSSRTASPLPFAAEDAFVLGSAALTEEAVEKGEGGRIGGGGDNDIANRGAEAENPFGNGRPLYRPAMRKVYSAAPAAMTAAAGEVQGEHEGDTVPAAAEPTPEATATATLKASGSDNDEDSGDRQHRAFTESDTMLSGGAYRGGGGDEILLGSPPGPGDGIKGLFAPRSAPQSGGDVDDGSRRGRSKSMTVATASAARVGSRAGLYADESGSSSSGKRMTNGVRLHWEPERLPSGEKHRTRRVVQLGLKGTWLEALGSGDVVVKIRRLDDLLAQQRAVLESSEPQLLSVPVARPLDCGHLPDSQLEALHLVSERARPKLRILCLHGYLQNAQIFRQRTRQLSKKLRPMADLVYVDAPHLLSAAEMPPPRVPSLASPLASAAEAAAKAAAAAAAKVVITGEGGAPGAKDYDVSNNSEEGEDDTTSVTSELPSSPETLRPCAAAAATALPGIGSSSSSSVGSPTAASASGSCSGGRPVGVANDREGARTWWRCDAEERRIAKAVKGMSGRCEWKGLEESLSFLKQVWDEQGPFDGILGFSQGAAMASIFHHCVFGAGSEQGGQVNGADGGSDGMGVTASSSLRGKVPSSPPPRFAAFVSGCYQPHPTQIPSYPRPQEADQVELPSLHVWAVDDPFVPANQSQRLAGMYLRSSILMHQGSHCVPQNKDTIQHVMRFLEEFR